MQHSRHLSWQTVFAGVRATPYLSRPAIDRFMTGGKRTNAFANSFFLSAVVVARRHMIEKTRDRWQAARALRHSSRCLGQSLQLI